MIIRHRPGSTCYVPMDLRHECYGCYQFIQNELVSLKINFRDEDSVVNYFC